MDNNQTTTDELILKPNFSKAESFEDLREIMSLYAMDIIVNVNSINQKWLTKISALERKGLIEVEYEKQAVSQ